MKSLGLIETFGLLAAVEAADAAVKSANVKLVGYELTKGSGMTTIKVEGDVGSVSAAVSAAYAAALKVGQVASVKVIPRPSDGIEGFIRNDETVGFEKPAEAANTALSKPIEKNLTVKEQSPIRPPSEAAKDSAKKDDTPPEPPEKGGAKGKKPGDKKK